MDVTFLGICIFKVNGSTAEAFMPNATAGIAPHVPPHNGVIAVRPGTVTPTNWNHTQTRIPAIDPNNDFWLFPLNGVNVTFTPAPPGGGSAFQLGQLPRTLAATFISCPNLTELNTTLTPALVSAHIDVGAGPLRAQKQMSGLAFTKLLNLASDVTVTATEFGTGTAHSIKVISATPMFIVNIHLAASGVHNDKEHLALYCKLLKPPQQPLSANAFKAKAANVARGITRFVDGAKGMLRFLRLRGRQDEFTLGTGCSNTQWP